MTPTTNRPTSHEIALRSCRCPDPDSPSDTLALANALALPVHELAAWLDLDTAGIHTCHYCHELYTRADYAAYCSFECYFRSRPRRIPQRLTWHQRRRKTRYNRRYNQRWREMRKEWERKARKPKWLQRIRASPF